MKKILMIGMTDNMGGIETYIMNVYRNLKSKYVLYFPFVENMAYKEEIETLGGKFIYGLPKSRRNPLAYYKAWDKAFKEYKFDAVYFNNCDIVNLDVLKLAKKNRVPIRIFHAHNSSNTLSTGAVHRLEEKHNRKISGKVITNMLACSRNAGEHIFEGYRYKEIKNGIDTKKFEFHSQTRVRKREELNISAEKKVILFVGRFTDIKNPLYAIDVIKECHRLDDRFEGLICGDGRIADRVQSKIQSEGLGDCVHLLGNREDVNELYMAADYLIMPSLFEGFPFVLVEAQCSGLKCICSDKVEKNTNLIGTVEYYPLEIKPKGWAEKIVGLEPEADRGKYPQAICEAGYDINQTVREIEDIFEGKE